MNNNKKNLKIWGMLPKIAKKIVGISMCVVTIGCIFSISGCANNNQNNLHYKVAFAEGFDENTTPFDANMYGSSSAIALEMNATEKINSLETLISFSNTKKYPFFDETAESYEHDLCKKIREYDKIYFEEKALILVIYQESSYDPSKIDALFIKDDTLTIIFAKPNEEYDTAQVITTFVHIIEVGKDDTKNVKSIKTEEIRKGKFPLVSVSLLSLPAAQTNSPL